MRLCGLDLGADRGQTLQDYAIGIGLFLVTVFFVIGLVVPSIMAPFQNDIGGEDEAQADHVATRLIENATVSGQMNVLDVSIVESIVDKDTDELRDRYQLPTTAWMNVSVRTLNGSDFVTSGGGVTLHSDENPEGAESATSARIVTLSDGSCDAACRLVVRVW